MTALYTVGYNRSGWTPETLAQCLEELDAVLVDIRYAPRSRVRHWNQARLARRLGPRYRHLQALGNRNYKDKSGAITLVDLPEGLRQIEGLLKDYAAVILMCVCPDPATCHRRVVAAACRAHLGLNAMELRPPA